MRFFADNDVFGSTIALLRSQGHDVQTAREAHLASAPDEDVLDHALRTGRVLVTNDTDHGSLAFLSSHLSRGIILMRVNRLTISYANEELLRMLAEHTEEELHRLFVVVEPGRHRIRRLL